MFPDRADRGSASVWLAGLMALIALVTTIGIVRGTAVIGRHRAEVAADLAALAGATALADGLDACAQAASFAVRNGATLTACVVVGQDVEVVVSRQIRFVRLGVRSVTARARAGPVDRADRADMGQVGSKIAGGVVAEFATTPPGSSGQWRVAVGSLGESSRRGRNERRFGWPAPSAFSAGRVAVVSTGRVSYVAGAGSCRSDGVSADSTR